MLHERGRVTASDESDLGYRSSVWINQELAILAYRQFFEERQLPVLVLKDPKVNLEGAMSALIVNAKPLGTQAEVVTAVREWLDKTTFAGVPDETFQRKWEELPDSARLVVAALIDEGGQDVKEFAVRRRLKDVYKVEPNQTDHAVREAKPIFTNTGLVKLIRNTYDGNEFTIHPTWEFHLRRETAKWLASRS